MPVHNTDIAGIFDEIADFLEIEGANPFRVRAYRNAARTAARISQNCRALAKSWLPKFVKYWKAARPKP
jgi:DNA polymerase (family 10)